MTIRGSTFTLMMKSLYVGILLLLLPILAWSDETYSVALPECTAKLERRTVEEGIVIVRSDCTLSLPSLVQLLNDGLRGLFPDHTLPVYEIYLGRLMTYPDLSKALAKAAAKSPKWNTKRGRPSNAGENDNHRIGLFLNGEVYPHDLKTVFAPYGLTACIADVEKVLVFKAKDIFTSQDEMSKLISPNALLPVDAQIWLRLQPGLIDCSSQN